ncbi:MAG: polysaccharide biosynthesis tyrosine autokinase [Leptolyngbyaceae cyanobacterium bins.59]|nr:polysaccharide biosynthesis tyrosine autokinase [Leptolyngbyaceae cyanobacterium bins.59]
MNLPIVKRYLIALEHYKWVGLGAFTLVVGVAGIVALQPTDPPTYVAEGVMAANRPTVSFSTTGNQITQQGQEILTPEILLAENVIKPVAQRVKTTPKQLQRALKVTVQQAAALRTGGQKPFQITLQYRSDEPRQAATIVTLLMQGMIEQSRMVNTTRLRATIQALNQRLPQMTRELRDAEQRLERYDRIEGPALLAAQDGSLLGAITTSDQQERQIQLTLQGIETQISSLQNRLGLNPTQAYAASALSADPIIANLRSQIYQTETQMETLRRDIRPNHPTMIELDKKRLAYEDLLRQRANELIGGENGTAPLSGGDQIRRDSSLDPARQQLANNLVDLQTQKETLQQQLVAVQRSRVELRQAYASIPNKQLERSRLEQQVTLKRSLYDKIQAALVDARAAEAETVSSLSVARPAEVQANVAAPKNIPITLGLGILMGLAVGGGLVFVLSALEGKFYTLEEIRSALRERETSLLGLLPVLPPAPDAKAGDIPVMIEADSPYLEIYERLRSNLRRVEGKALKVILMTSVIAQEGKTVVAYNLAIASARAGRRTLLLEADLRSPSQARSLNVLPDPDSQSEPLRYYGQLGDCIRLVPEVENLYIVPSPGPQQQAAAILESSEFRRLLEDVRGRFDWVILDTPPLSECNDALLMEPFADGLILVTRPAYTENALLSESLDQLNESEVRFLGAVINGAEVTGQLPHKGDEPPSDDSFGDGSSETMVEAEELRTVAMSLKNP